MKSRTQTDPWTLKVLGRSTIKTKKIVIIQKKCAGRSKDFENYIGPYLFIGVNNASCEIESLAHNKKKILHAND